MKSVNIYSKRFFIRNFKLTDVTPRYLSWLADKNSIKYIKHHNFNKISQLTKYAKRILKKKNTVFLGIFHNSKHIGNIKFDSINNKKSTSFLGILIGDKEWRNKSVGSEVIKICAEKFYQDFGIRKIFLVVDKKNKIAINSYKKSNFVIEKEIKKNGKKLILMKRDHVKTKIAIGTAQFGLKYGIANKTGKVSLNEMKKIKKIALANGVNTVDTAPAYGNSEDRIGKLGYNNFNLVSKLPMLPPAKNRVSWVIKSIRNSLKKLKTRKLYAVFVHNTKFLLNKDGHQIFNTLLKLKKKGIILKIGVSIYTIDELKKILKKFKIDIVLVPYNVIDQRVKTTGMLKKLKKLNIEIYSRSSFLQGLLLIKRKKILSKFNKWKPLFKIWENKIKNSNKSAREICLNFVLSQKEIDKFVIGVDSSRQFEDILKKAKPGFIETKNLVSNNQKNLINPSKWNNL